MHRGWGKQGIHFASAGLVQASHLVLQRRGTRTTQTHATTAQIAGPVSLPTPKTHFARKERDRKQKKNKPNQNILNNSLLFLLLEFNFYAQTPELEVERCFARLFRMRANIRGLFA